MRGETCARSGVKREAGKRTGRNDPTHPRLCRAGVLPCVTCCCCNPHVVPFTHMRAGHARLPFAGRRYRRAPALSVCVLVLIVMQQLRASAAAQLPPDTEQTTWMDVWFIYHTFYVFLVVTCYATNWDNSASPPICSMHGSPTWSGATSSKHATWIRYRRPRRALSRRGGRRPPKRACSTKVKRASDRWDRKIASRLMWTSRFPRRRIHPRPHRGPYPRSWTSRSYPRSAHGRRRRHRRRRHRRRRHRRRRRTKNRPDESAEWSVQCRLGSARCGKP